MLDVISLVCFVAASLGLLVLVTQVFAVRRHAAEKPRGRTSSPGLSVLKPLCGVDDDLEENIERFAQLDYPEYEVLLGVRNTSDTAYPLAMRAAARWPERMRVVIQNGEPGLNPKVNQLITLGYAARYDILVISDSNVRVDRGYLSELAAEFEDPQVALVTNPIVGVGEQTLGALLDNLHMSTQTAPAMIAAKRVAGMGIVVGKSMALRRDVVEALGGFESLKDILAEDFVTGQRVRRELNGKIAVAHLPVQNVVRQRTVSGFFARYRRWNAIQRWAVPTPLYLCQSLLNPSLLAAFGFAFRCTPTTGGVLAGFVVARALCDWSYGRSLRPAGFELSMLLASPLRDLLLGAAWLSGLFVDEVCWRGTRLRIAAGTRLVPAGSPIPSEPGGDSEPTLSPSTGA
jgi:ceramide glucosyltransferase